MFKWSRVMEDHFFAKLFPGLCAATKRRRYHTIPPYANHNMRTWLLTISLVWLVLVGADADEERELDDPYDPDKEPPVSACRRDPTWKKTVDFQRCQELTQWFDDDVWTKIDKGHVQEVLGDKEAVIGECLEQAFVDAKQKYHYDWAMCDENKKTHFCAMEEPTVLSHYSHESQGKAVV